MKTIFEYLIIIVILFALFYATACLIENTFSLSEMRVSVREWIFGIWLSISMVLSIMIVIYKTEQKEKKTLLEERRLNYEKERKILPRLRRALQKG